MKFKFLTLMLLAHLVSSSFNPDFQLDESKEVNLIANEVYYLRQEVGSNYIDLKWNTTKPSNYTVTLIRQSAGAAIPRLSLNSTLATSNSVRFEGLNANTRYTYVINYCSGRSCSNLLRIVDTISQGALTRVSIERTRQRNACITTAPHLETAVLFVDSSTSINVTGKLRRTGDERERFLIARARAGFGNLHSLVFDSLLNSTSYDYFVDYCWVKNTQCQGANCKEEYACGAIKGNFSTLSQRPRQGDEVLRGVQTCFNLTTTTQNTSLQQGRQIAIDESIIPQLNNVLDDNSIAILNNVFERQNAQEEQNANAQQEEEQPAGNAGAGNAGGGSGSSGGGSGSGQNNSANASRRAGAQAGGLVQDKQRPAGANIARPATVNLTNQTQASQNQTNAQQPNYLIYALIAIVAIALIILAKFNKKRKNNDPLIFKIL